MSDFEIMQGDIVKVTIAGIKMLMIVEALRSSKIVRLISGQSLADATRLLPDMAPNAMNRIMLCGRTAPIGTAEVSPEMVKNVQFFGPETCVFLESVEGHLPQPRKDIPADAVRMK